MARIFPLGDSALTVDFGNLIDETVNREVIGLFRRMKEERIPHITDLVPAYSSLTVHYDVFSIREENPGETAFDYMTRQVEMMLDREDYNDLSEGRLVRVPVCYGGAYGPDLAELAAAKGLSEEEVVRIHSSVRYRVYMIGFLPGFAYMGQVNEQISMPRKAQPRTNVAAGSVGIAGRQTGIYPLDSPGGWQVIGRTPLRLFHAGIENTVLFQPGDMVEFYSMSEHEFENYQGGHS
ncbi:MAG TPA: 5-oxoprolinase subunit PxpB [Flavisolibacter sp.]|jgi:inhibitor of KinA